MDAAERFSSIKCATLILWGIDDMEEFERLGLALAKDRFFLSQAIPHGQVVEFPNGTICMMNQIPEEIANVVIEFLN
jgi:pimeloyl-ACP methyl ester carboxylesterase